MIKRLKSQLNCQKWRGFRPGSIVALRLVSQLGTIVFGIVQMQKQHQRLMANMEELSSISQECARIQNLEKMLKTMLSEPFWQRLEKVPMIIIIKPFHLTFSNCI